MLKRTLTLIIIATALFAAKKERVWKLARVLDSNSDISSYVTGTTSNTFGGSTTTGSVNGTGNNSASVNATTTGNATTTSTVHRASIQQNQLLLAGEGYFYVIHDERMRSGPLLVKAISNKHHGCRFIVGEDVKYAQDKGDIYVLDVDGKECKAPILRQEKR